MSVSITFRTDDGTRWGAGNAANLTPEQFDLNFWEVKLAIETLISTQPTPNEIASFSVSGSAMFVHMMDGTTYGPLPLPILTFRDRGVWLPNTLYLALDLVRVDDVGLFLVNVEHTSDTVFDPAAVDSGTSQLIYHTLFAFAQPGDDLEEGIAATGTNQATATQLLKAQSYVDTDVDGTKGVRFSLNLMIPGKHLYVANEHATNTLPIYPPAGVSFNAQASNAAISGGIPGNSTAHFVVKNSTTIRSVP